jgi:formate dehydrogenase maturation protein FdhE
MPNRLLEQIEIDAKVADYNATNRRRWLPCPICGSVETVALIQKGYTFSGAPLFLVHCQKCQLCTNPKVKMYIAVRKWNELAKRITARIDQR